MRLTSSIIVFIFSIRTNTSKYIMPHIPIKCTALVTKMTDPAGAVCAIEEAVLAAGQITLASRL